jgi:hypothetical protein
MAWFLFRYRLGVLLIGSANSEKAVFADLRLFVVTTKAREQIKDKLCLSCPTNQRVFGLGFYNRLPVFERDL